MYECSWNVNKNKQSTNHFCHDSAVIWQFVSHRCRRNNYYHHFHRVRSVPVSSMNPFHFEFGMQKLIFASKCCDCCKLIAFGQWMWHFSESLHSELLPLALTYSTQCAHKWTRKRTDRGARAMSECANVCYCYRIWVFILCYLSVATTQSMCDKVQFRTRTVAARFTIFVHFSCHLGRNINESNVQTIDKNRFEIFVAGE